MKKDLLRCDHICWLLCLYMGIIMMTTSPFISSIFIVFFFVWKLIWRNRSETYVWIALYRLVLVKTGENFSDHYKFILWTACFLILMFFFHFYANSETYYYLIKKINGIVFINTKIRKYKFCYPTICFYETIDILTRGTLICAFHSWPCPWWCRISLYNSEYFSN